MAWAPLRLTDRCGFRDVLAQEKDVSFLSRSCVDLVVKLEVVCFSILF